MAAQVGPIEAKEGTVAIAWPVRRVPAIKKSEEGKATQVRIISPQPPAIGIKWRSPIVESIASEGCLRHSAVGLCQRLRSLFAPRVELVQIFLIQLRGGKGSITEDYLRTTFDDCGSVAAKHNSAFANEQFGGLIRLHADPVDSSANDGKVRLRRDDIDQPFGRLGAHCFDDCSTFNEPYAQTLERVIS